MPLRRVAIYGGTFDPVHNGHLAVARKVLKLFELDELFFVPACVPPHKRNANITSAFHRFAMLALATEPDQRLRISTIELDSPDRPYAVDTIGRMQNESRHLYFVIGADSWAEITTWHEWEKLLQLCDLIVMTRPGYPIVQVPANAKVVDLRGFDEASVREASREEKPPRVFLTDAVEMDVSATRIREAGNVNDVAALKEMVPPRVAEYIAKYNLYGN
jgi:nicotinate-nucleotide adenylyltransferase